MSIEFAIIGAMKAGTSTLQALLEQHPEVTLHPQEDHSLSLDDFDESAEHHLTKARQAVRSPLPEGRIRGVRGTTWLTARGAAEQARQRYPNLKIVVCLRDPVDRAWSHYWHLVRSGRAILPFEAALMHHRGTLLKRSRYEPGLSDWRAAFQEVHVVSFDQLISDPCAVANEVVCFLGLEPVTMTPVHAHRGTAPRWLRMRLFANWVELSGGPRWVASAARRLAGDGAPVPELSEETRRTLERVLEAPEPQPLPASPGHQGRL